jgi:hypothetical protein
MGYEWDMSRLDKLQPSGFNKGFAVAADLMMQHHCQIKRATTLLSVMFPSIFILPDTRRILSGSDRTKVCTADKSMVCHIANTSDLEPKLLCEVGYYALPSQREKVPA